MGGRVWDVRRTAESCVDVVIKRPAFGPLHQNTVKPYLNG
jgi:hypothetical protein